MKEDYAFEIKVVDYLNLRVRKVSAWFTEMGLRLSSYASRLRFIKYELLFGERDDDIYVMTYPKSGTTWMQMILYQLTTDGNVDFEHIYDVSPWLRSIAHLEEPIPDVPSPRIIKSHDPYEFVKKGKKGRFIVVLRDGMDVASSLYHHKRDYVNASLTFSDSFKMSFQDKGKENYFTFTEQWLKNPKGFNTMYIRYEDLKTDFDGSVKRLADYIGVELTPAIMERTRERASFDFMKQHESKFGEQPEKKNVRVYNNFIRKGETGTGHKYMDEKEKMLYLKEFHDKLAKFKIMQDYFERAVSSTKEQQESKKQNQPELQNQ